MGIANISYKINQFVDPSRKMSKPLTDVKPQIEEPKDFKDTFKSALSHPDGKGLFVDSAL